MAFQNIESIRKCYEMILKDFSCFETISLERKEEIDNSLGKEIKILRSKNPRFSNLRSNISDKLIASGQRQYKLTNGDELAYFYVLVLDPELKLLNAYNENKEEFANYCKLHFALYDKYILFLVKLEMLYKIKFIDLEINENLEEDTQKRS